MDEIKALIALVKDLEKDGSGFYQKGHLAAGTRVRKRLQQVKELATVIRKDILEKRQAVS